MDLSIYKKCNNPPCRGGLNKRELKRIAKKMGIKVPRGVSKSELAASVASLASVASVAQYGAGPQNIPPTMYQGFPANLLAMRPLPAVPAVPAVPLAPAKPLPPIPAMPTCTINMPRQCGEIRIKMV